MKSAADLIKILQYGGGVIINAATYGTDDLIKIAQYTTKEKGPTITMKGAKTKTTDDLVKIAQYAGGNVIFDLSE